MSPKGLYFADRHSSKLRDIREQPKIITILVIKNKEGKVLLQKKGRQPFVNSYHLPAGKIHEKESLNEAAKRELFEKTGINDVELNFAASVHARIYKEGELVSDFVGFIFNGNLNQDKPENAIWHDLTSNKYDLAPSVAELLKLAESKSGSPEEIVIDL